MKLDRNRETRAEKKASLAQFVGRVGRSAQG